MAPKLRILASSPTSSYPPTQPLPVNSNTPTQLKTPHFEGEISVWVKDYTGDNKEGDGEEYFGMEGRGGMTYAIVVRGRFLEDIDGDQLIFGNLFEKPIRDGLPWGTSIAMKAMHFVDPNLQLDVYADKPWAMSPTLATFNFLSLHKDKPEYAPCITEDSLERLGEMYDGDSPPPESTGDPATEKTARKRWLGYPEHRKAVKVDKSTWVGMEFCNGLLDFNTLSFKLPPPFNMSFPLLQYWDGQPVTYACKRRAKTEEGENQGQGTVFWSVAFEIIDEDARRMLAEKQGKSGGGEQGEGKADEADEGEAGKGDGGDGDLSDDVD